MRTIRGSSGNDNLIGSTGNDLIYGNNGNDYLYGDLGKDTLDGGAGSDYMVGGKGNDTYVVDNRYDRVIEKSYEGVDTIYSSVSYSLPTYVENLTLSGKANLVGYGTNYNNVIQGNYGNDVLYGYDGNDTFFTCDSKLENFWGSAGHNTMYGGRGHDTYLVNDKYDKVIEKGGEGTDTVYSTVSYTLPFSVEKLFIVTLGNINGTGNDSDNEIHGNCGRNYLWSGNGNDQIFGGRGNDTLDGGTGNDLLSGGLGNEIIYGGIGNDTLEGGADNDALYGGYGNDTYRGYQHKYVASYTGQTIIGSGNDVINDVSGYDRLNVSNYEYGNTLFYALDKNHDSKKDALMLKLANEGTVTIENYFDNSSSQVDGSHKGSGYIEDIEFKHHHIQFDDIQYIF